MYNLPVTKQQLDEQQWKQKKKKLKVETEKNKIKGTILKVLYILITDPFSGWKQWFKLTPPPGLTKRLPNAIYHPVYSQEENIMFITTLTTSGTYPGSLRYWGGRGSTTNKDGMSASGGNPTAANIFS